MSFRKFLNKLPFSKEVRLLRNRFEIWIDNFPLLTTSKTIIGINLIVFLGWKIVNPTTMQRHFVLNDYNLRSGRYHTIFTHSFSHQRFSHLAFNGIGFYFFMLPMEMYYGASTVIYLYALGSFGGYWAAKLKYRKSWMPSHLGASGALYALVTYYILLNPKSTIYLYFFHKTFLKF